MQVAIQFVHQVLYSSCCCCFRFRSICIIIISYCDAAPTKKRFPFLINEVRIHSCKWPKPGCESAGAPTAIAFTLSVFIFSVKIGALGTPDASRGCGHIQWTHATIRVAPQIPLPDYLRISLLLYRNVLILRNPEAKPNEQPHGLRYIPTAIEKPS